MGFFSKHAGFNELQSTKLIGVAISLPEPITTL
jgi:hypothetical protein